MSPPRARGLGGCRPNESTQLEKALHVNSLKNIIILFVTRLAHLRLNPNIRTNGEALKFGDTLR